jgi:hypothetical protein
VDPVTGQIHGECSLRQQNAKGCEEEFFHGVDSLEVQERGSRVRAVRGRNELRGHESGSNLEISYLRAVMVSAGSECRKEIE